MKEILLNLANHLLLDFCKQNSIILPSAGSYITKEGRGFTYALRSNANNELVASITFHKSHVPTFVLDYSRRNVSPRDIYHLSEKVGIRP